MTTPSSLPNVTTPVQDQLAAEQATPEVVKVAGRIVRTKSFLSKQLKTTVPAFVAGAGTTLLVAARRSRQSEYDVEIDTPSDSTE